MSDPRFVRLSRVIAVGNAPVLVRQAARISRETPRLPEAGGEWWGEAPGLAPIRLLVLGDSTAAGVGVETQQQGLAGHLASVLADRSGRGVAWRVVGQKGATTHDVIERMLHDVLSAPADLLVLSIGANDAIHARSTAAFRRDLRRILTAFSTANPDALVLMSPLPAFFRFPLPDPLRSVLYRHSQNLEQVARQVIAEDPRWMITGRPPPIDETFFAADRFHPSAEGYRDWAHWVVDDGWDRGLASIAPPRGTAR